MAETADSAAVTAAYRSCYCTRPRLATARAVQRVAQRGQPYCRRSCQVAALRPSTRASGDHSTGSPTAAARQLVSCCRARSGSSWGAFATHRCDVCGCGSGAGRHCRGRLGVCGWHHESRAVSGEDEVPHSLLCSSSLECVPSLAASCRDVIRPPSPPQGRGPRVAGVGAKLRVGACRSHLSHRAHQCVTARLPPSRLLPPARPCACLTSPAPDFARSRAAWRPRPR